MSNQQCDAVRLVERLRAARQYLGSPSGQALVRAERACLGPVLENLAGRHGLEMTAGGSLLDLSAVGHVMEWAPRHEDVRHASTLVCAPDAIPLADESMELVLIHHLLEMVPEPHHLLREAARVTDHNGRLLIIGWHPYGSACARHWLARRYGSWPMGGVWRSVSRLRDWLTFVDFEIEHIDYCGFAPPSASLPHDAMEALGRRWNLPLGQSFVIRAKRRIQRVTPVRPRFTPRLLVPGGSLHGGVSAARQPCNDERHCYPRDRRAKEFISHVRREHS
ncbi:methyltransferase family protein [Kushneria sinocarnis]|uniref:Methyltransferase family protein n=1 Tax=Kushneria sinocarnis TaxID=595502 RepID=A0A420WYI9_9GAMM|nr:methyltransferase domain-containing protein [Kushneria sinocarnis]RKR06246.1 methyltransferase family protein [Kushneria sinocarnis]